MILSSLFWLSLQVAGFSLAGAVLFLLLRRRGPSAAATGAASVLLLTLPLLLVAFSPWPRWELAWKPDNAPAASGELTESRVELPPLDGDAILLAPPPETEPAGLPLADWWQTAAAMFEPPPPAQTQAAVPEVEPHRPTWLLWLLVVGVAIGLARLVVGLWAVRSLRTESQPIDDAELQACIAEVREKLVAEFVRIPGTSQDVNDRNSHALPLQVDVRESSRLRSAATIGWRRPILLLPGDWRAWTDVERRVVIAHELAHVARRDYLLVLVARLATAIHFYQPLVLWLARQLRVQQELAADTIAARVTGSRQTYLTTLAQMALRADEQTIPWPARAFLPGAGLLVKRVRWLKHNKTQEERTMNRKSRWTMYAALAAMALLVAGIRGPSPITSPVVAAEQPPIDLPDVDDADFVVIEHVRTADYVPANARSFAAVSTNSLSKTSIGNTLLKLAKSDIEEAYGIDITKIDDIKLVQVTGDGLDRLVFRAKLQHDWTTAIAKFAPNAERQTAENGKEYFKTQQPLPPNGDCYFLPDDRTLVIATEGEIQKMLAGEESIKNFRLTTAELVVHADVATLRRAIPYLDVQAGSPVLGPLFDAAKSVTFSGALAPSVINNGRPSNEKVYLTLLLSYKADDSIKQAADTLAAIRTLTINSTNFSEQQAAEMAQHQPERLQLHLNQEVWKLIKKFLESTNIETNKDPSFVVANGEVELPTETIASVLQYVTEENREAVRVNLSKNNMKQIAIALHNYNSARKNFPPAAGVGKDGKTLHSWRVAILPYLEEERLYRDYRFDEPWDSEHNRQFIDKMPAVFRDPNDAEDSTSSAYYMITGKGTVGESATGTRFRDISDGTAKTIMLVQAKRNIPWTKPEDIEIDPDAEKPLPKFGGFMQPEGTFLAAFADGAVHTIAARVDSKALRTFFTIAGGEPPQQEVLDPQPPAPPPPAPKANEDDANERNANERATGRLMLGVGVTDSDGPQTPLDERHASAVKLKRNVINLKRIGLALHNYARANRHFPPPVIVGPDGKTKHSWRVAILPFLEGAYSHDGRDFEGYKIKTQYRFDESWDSPNNRQVMAEMPDAFRSPFDEPDSLNSAYYMIVGKGTFGDTVAGRTTGRPTSGPTIAAEITDGMENTIMVVEAKRDVPWTKPDDLEVDLAPDKPLPKFGGFLPHGVFGASFASGHVRPLSNEFEPKSLRALLTIDGGEDVDLKALVPPEIYQKAIKPAAPMN